MRRTLQRKKVGLHPAAIISTEKCEERLYLSPIFDVNSDGVAEPLTDGVFIARYLAGFRGRELGGSTQRGLQIAANIENISPWLDIDQDDSAQALTDGVMMIRYLAGFEGERLTAGAINNQGRRTDPVQIQQFLTSPGRPQISPIGEARIAQSESLQFTVEAQPIPGDTSSTFQFDAAPDGATIDSETGSVTWHTTTQTVRGEHQFVIRATASDGSFSTEDFTVNVVDEHPEVVVTVDYFDSAWEHVVNNGPEPNEDYIRDLVRTHQQNGTDTLVVRSGALGLFHFQTELSYPIGSFDTDHVDEFLSRFRLIEGLSGTDIETYKQQRSEIHSLLQKLSLRFNPMKVFVDEGRAAGLKVVMWVDLFDDSYAGYRSKFLTENPGAYWRAADGTKHPALISYAYETSRQFRTAQVQELLEHAGADGVYLSTSAHSRHFYVEGEPKEYGFEKPIADEYERRTGDDLRTTESIDRDIWNEIKGDFMHQLYREIKQVTNSHGAELWIGQQLGESTNLTLNGAYTGPVVASYANQTQSLIDDQIADVLIVNDYEYTSVWAHPGATKYWSGKEIDAGATQQELFAWAENHFGDPVNTKLIVWGPVSTSRVDAEVSLFGEFVTRFHFDGAMLHESLNFEQAGFETIRELDGLFNSHWVE